MFPAHHFWNQSADADDGDPDLPFGGHCPAFPPVASDAPIQQQTDPLAAAAAAAAAQAARQSSLCVVAGAVV